MLAWFKSLIVAVTRMDSGLAFFLFLKNIVLFAVQTKLIEVLISVLKCVFRLFINIFYDII